MKTTLCITLASAALAVIHPVAVSAQQLSPAAGATLLPSEPRINGFIMVDGRMHAVRDGVARPVEQDLVLRVTPDGIVGFDQLPRFLPNNSMMTLDGQIVAAPGNLVVPPSALVDAARLPDPRLAPGTVAYGTSTSGLAPNRTIVTQRSISPSGPRFISAKKNTAAKSRKTSAKKVTTQTSAKKTAAKAATPVAAKPAAPLFQPFNDSVLELPDLEFVEEPVSPTIDATSTMLYMTANGDPAWTPENESIKASMGTDINTDATPE